MTDSIKESARTHLTSELIAQNLKRHAQSINSEVDSTFRFEVKTLQKSDIHMTRRKHITPKLIF